MDMLELYNSLYTRISINIVHYSHVAYTLAWTPWQIKAFLLMNKRHLNTFLLIMACITSIMYNTPNYVLKYYNSSKYKVGSCTKLNSSEHLHHNTVIRAHSVYVSVCTINLLAIAAYIYVHANQHHMYIQASIQCEECRMQSSGWVMAGFFVEVEWSVCRSNVSACRQHGRSVYVEG